jgi:sugar/nucleoside kinase (ribokinase family)
MKVVCVGDCGIDHYQPSGEKRFGGITANFARHAKRAFPVKDDIEIISCVGNDESAALVLSSLASSGITSHISKLTGNTPVQTIDVDAHGEKNFLHYDEGVLRDFSFADNEQKIIAQCNLLVAPVYLQIVDLLDDLLAIETTGITAIDFADFLQHPDFALLDRHIDRIDIGFFGLSLEDAETINRLAELASGSGTLFIVTLGADGSIALDGDKRFECCALPVDKVVDTTGAGDAFAAGFLSRYCHGISVQDALGHGAALAAGVITSIGGYNAEGTG